MKRVLALLLAVVASLAAGCTSVRYPARNPHIDYEANKEKPFVAHRNPGQNRMFLKVDRGVVSGTVDRLIATASGDELVSCSMDKTVRVFDAKTGREKRKFLWNITDDSGSPDSIALSHDESFLVVAVDDRLLVYDFQTAVLKEEIPVGGRVGAIDISADDRYMAVAQKDRITIWGMVSRKPVRTVSGNAVAVKFIKVGRNYHLIHANHDENLYISDGDPLSEKRKRPLGTHEISLMTLDSDFYWSDFKYQFEMDSIAVSEQRQEIAVASRANNVVWVCGLKENRSGPEVLELKTVIRTKTENIAQLAFSRDGGFLSVDSWDEELCEEVYETGNYTLVAELRAKKAQGMWPTAFAGDGTLVGIGHDDGAFQYWDFSKPVGNGIRKHTGVASITPKRSVAFNGNYLAWGTRFCKYDGGFSGDGFDENCLALENALDLNTLQLTHGVNTADFQRVRVENERYRLELGPTNFINPDLIFRLKSKKTGKTVLYVDIPPEDGWVPHAYGLTDDLIISGNRSGCLVAYDFKGEKVIDFEGHTSTVQSVSIMGSTLVTADLSGEILLWKIPSAGERNSSGTTKVHPLFTFVLDDTGRYLIIADDGYFAGAYDLLPRVWLHVNGEKGNMGASWLGLNQLYDLFYRPDIVRARLQRLDGMDGLQPARMDEAIDCPPPEIVQLTATETSPGNMDIAYTVRDTGGGIGQIRFYINGKLFHAEEQGLGKNDENGSSLHRVLSSNNVVGRLRGLKRVGSVGGKPLAGQAAPRPGAEKKGHVTVKAISGKNTIRVAAFNEKNSVQGMMKETVAVSTAPPRKPSVYALLVGIDAYANETLNLSNAVTDAKVMEAIVRRHVARVYDTVEVKSLYDCEATKGKILESLAEIGTAAGPEDVFLLFVASHGEVADQFYLITNNYAEKNGTFDPASWLPAAQLMAALEEIPAQKQLVIFDTCHSGSLNDTMGGFYDARMATFTHKAGVTMFSSTQASQQSVDNYKGSGLLVHLLKQAFNARPDTDRSKDVGVYEIGDEIKRRFQEIDASVRSIQQPSVSKFGVDFPVDKT